MKAAVVTEAGKAPVFKDFAEPTPIGDVRLVHVTASAISHFTKARSSGRHYSSNGGFPAVAGADGVGRTAEGERVYFLLPETPYGSLAEQTMVRSAQCIAIPDALDDVTAAAIANPGMSAWAALVERAHMQPGETVLINGATGSAGTLAVQLAKYLGAGKVIVTGRDEEKLARLHSIGADVSIRFEPGPLHSKKADRFEEALKREFQSGVHVVLDYLWGKSAEIIISAIAKAVENANPVRFVHIGAASGEDTIALVSAALRSSAIELRGTGLKSVPLPKLLACIQKVFESVEPAGLKIATTTMPLSEIEQAWVAPGKPRMVITIP